MLRRFGALSLLFLSLAPSPVAQTPSSSKPSTFRSDYSQEAFVIEEVSHKEKFENDGTSSSTDTARVKIQSEAGVQRYGLLSFSYPSAIGTFEIDYVRVRKPDGSVVETSLENVQDMAAQITREAPFYSDLHEKHVAVKGLSVGDVLEFRTKGHTTKPLASGQFWTNYRFSDEVIVLDERLEITLSRPVRCKFLFCFFVERDLELRLAFCLGGFGSCPLLVPDAHLHPGAKVRYLFRRAFYDPILVKPLVPYLVLPHTSLNKHQILAYAHEL